MNTQEIEKLLIEHADDFRELLDTPITGMMAKFADGQPLFYTEECQWHMGHVGTIPASLAVAAMTEAWREKLEKMHDVRIRQDVDRYEVSRYKRDGIMLPCMEYLHKTGNGWWSCRHGHFPGECSFNSIPEAICAAVKALAAEKRKAQARNLSEKVR